MFMILGPVLVSILTASNPSCHQDCDSSHTSLATCKTPLSRDLENFPKAELDRPGECEAPHHANNPDESPIRQIRTGQKPSNNVGSKLLKALRRSWRTVRVTHGKACSMSNMES
ncbi:hypothetical protein CC80DRAFT_297604 [Byssothecium circinans]|uniref:Secreted protein n=1 Tax=Byssothecium circinans TaxID=147558 RepID=A0A6A5TAK8_9PLEO|nr:hypothetical protein CC80DRAFT_297604 [Byssothecium circinans]